MLGLGLITGIAGRIRAQVAGWDLVRNASEQEPLSSSWLANSTPTRLDGVRMPVVSNASHGTSRASSLRSSALGSLQDPGPFPGLIRRRPSGPVNLGHQRRTFAARIDCGRDTRRGT